MIDQRILPYIEMCQREGTSLQRGMNFRLRGKHSVILMSRRPDAPYADRIEEDGSVLIYEGHDAPRTSATPYPKQLDQPECRPSGKLTENGKFKKAALDYRKGLKGPDFVRVYEKLFPGLWADNGYFHLVDAWQETADDREVFKFKLVAIKTDDESLGAEEPQPFISEERRRIIPSAVKQEVWKRDHPRRAGAALWHLPGALRRRAERRRDILRARRRHRYRDGAVAFLCRPAWAGADHP